MSILARLCGFPYKRVSGLMARVREGNVMERQRWRDRRGQVGETMR